jgi:DNA-binding GntR family transcriptional regulator
LAENGWELRARCSTALHDNVIRYAKSHGMTMAGAVRDLLRRQVRYWIWVEDVKRRGPSPDSLRRLARSLLEKHPEATKNALIVHMEERMGRYPDTKAVRKIANEFFPR